MPNHISAMKQLAQSKKRMAVNRRNKGLLRASLRNIRQALVQGNLEKSRQQIPQALSRIDKSVQKRIIHKNTAGRLKSRLSARLNELARTSQAQPSS